MKLPNKIAAKLVADSIYVKGEDISPAAQRFVVVMAVPYGVSDGVETIREAVEGFQRLIADDDWEERTFQVYDAESGKIVAYCPEEHPEWCQDCDGPLNEDGTCPSCDEEDSDHD